MCKEKKHMKLCAWKNLFLLLEYVTDKSREDAWKQHTVISQAGKELELLAVWMKHI